MNLDFVPHEVMKIVKKHRAHITPIPPTRGSSFNYLEFAEVQIATQKITVEVELLCNTNSNTTFNISAIKWMGYEFMDEPNITLLTILDSILVGNIHKKKSILGKEKLFITDSEGNEYWPRG
jgi:hypothetical protein